MKRVIQRKFPLIINHQYFHSQTLTFLKLPNDSAPIFIALMWTKRGPEIPLLELQQLTDCFLKRHAFQRYFKGASFQN